MKSLMEFVSCCGCATTTTANNDSINASIVLELGRSEETRALVNSPRRYQRRKRGRVGASGGGEWRPSLSSIDEDHVFMIERRKRIEVERTVKKKVSLRCGSYGRGPGRSFSDDSSERNPFPVMPAFSPAPFMF